MGKKLSYCCGEDFENIKKMHFMTNIECILQSILFYKIYKWSKLTQEGDN